MARDRPLLVALHLPFFNLGAERAAGKELHDVECFGATVSMSAAQAGAVK